MYFLFQTPLIVNVKSDSIQVTLALVITCLNEVSYFSPFSFYISSIMLQVAKIFKKKCLSL